MKKFTQWLSLKETVTYNYDRNKFISFPWNWQAMQQAKIVNPLYYYAKENYVDGQPEQLSDSEWAVITLANMKGSIGMSSNQTPIPANELSEKNMQSGNKVNQMDFLMYLKKPQAWYDNKIDQVYDSIQMIGKKPEDFGGKDIR
jgi:hypothetical protein